MAPAAHIWSPDDWEDYCGGLFRQRHGPTGYVRVPDRDRGDLGMEGYTIDGTGMIYQCYATEAVEVGQRYEHQRDKMTKDLGKLAAKPDRVAALLGDNVMSFWALVVPVHDSKDLVVHARVKEQEMRARDLSFLANDFKVVILTETDFAVERAALDAAGIGDLPPSAPLAEEDVEKAVGEIMSSEPNQVQTMNEKLGRAGVVDAVDLRERLLQQVVYADNIREHLRVSFPTTSESVLTQLGIEERAIMAERDFGLLHKGSVVDVRERLAGRLADNVPALGQGEADRLAHGQVGRWLLECPLDFPEADA